ncbi:MAG: ABC transporter ATP-binding protein [Spirochaetaceae bacterium]|nr:ABC transporter ATP-binding protein [Spirochaetaceae bacterium]MBO5236517.1 ABC transporter ATP-binding protein [Spirochaetaceae bacterium]
MTNNYFVAENLCKTWKDSGEISKQISFSLRAEKSSMTALVGPSGSGKSTILRMIAGFVAPDNLKKDCILSLDGKNLLSLPPGKRNVGMVFQNATLFPHLTIEDNVAYGLRCAGKGKEESRKMAAEFLEKFELAGFSKRKPESLSGGEAQRVALARTLILWPKLVLFDEPLSALDTSLRKRLAKDIVMMQKERGFTGIFVTHDIQEAEFVSDKILYLK